MCAPSGVGYKYNVGVEAPLSKKYCTGVPSVVFLEIFKYSARLIRSTSISVVVSVVVNKTASSMSTKSESKV